MFKQYFLLMFVILFYFTTFAKLDDFKNDSKREADRNKSSESSSSSSSSSSYDSGDGGCFEGMGEVICGSCSGEFFYSYFAYISTIHYSRFPFADNLPNGNNFIHIIDYAPAISKVDEHGNQLPAERKYYTTEKLKRFYFNLALGYQYHFDKGHGGYFLCKVNLEVLLELPMI